MTLNIANGSSLVATSYPLIGYSGSLTGGTGAFTTVNVPGLPAGDTSSLAFSGNVLDMVITAPASVVNGIWQTGSGSWSMAGNWNNSGQVPGSHVQDTAVFGTVATSGGTVTLDSSQSVASLGFSNSGGASY